MYAFQVSGILGQDKKAAIYRKRKENVNHKDESELQNLIFLKLPHQQNMHKTSQISRASMQSAKINLPKKPIMKPESVMKSNIFRNHYRKREESRVTVTETSEHPTSKLSCRSEIPVI